MRFKVCGMRYPDNIAALGRLQPDYMGFVFYPHSARAVPRQDGQVRSFIAGIQHILTVGVFVEEAAELVLQTVQAYGLDRVQLHGTASPAYCAALEKHVPVIKSFSIDETFDWRLPALYENSCSYFLFDTATPQFGGSGWQFDWQLLHNYTGDKPYFLSGGIGPEQVAGLKAITDKRLYAIDVNSRFELQPGLKNISLIQTFQHELYNQ